jgi:hypothetical protein
VWHLVDAAVYAPCCFLLRCPVLEQPASLAELPVPKARCLDRGLASPSCASVACAGNPARAVWPHCPPNLAHLLATDVRTKSLSASPPCKPLPLPALAALCARTCTLALSERGRALCTVLSHPITPSARAYKRRPHPLHLVRAIDLMSSPVSRSLLPLFSVAAATVDNAAHRLSISMRRSSCFTELWSCSPSRRTPTCHVGALPHHHSAAELPL